MGLIPITRFVPVLALSYPIHSVDSGRREQFLLEIVSYSEPERANQGRLSLTLRVLRFQLLFYRDEDPLE
jgi:hypothetical protein